MKNTKNMSHVKTCSACVRREGVSGSGEEMHAGQEAHGGRMQLTTAAVGLGSRRSLPKP